MQAPKLIDVTQLEHEVKKYTYKTECNPLYYVREITLGGYPSIGHSYTTTDLGGTSVTFDTKESTITIIGDAIKIMSAIGVHVYKLVDAQNGDIVAVSCLMRDIKKFARAYDRECEGDWTPELFDRGRFVERWKY